MIHIIVLDYETGKIEDEFKCELYRLNFWCDFFREQYPNTKRYKICVVQEWVK